MLSRQESPTFPSSQIFLSDPTAKLFLLRAGERTGTQLPLLALLNSLESSREFLGPTNTAQPRHQQFTHLSAMDPSEILNPFPVLQHSSELEFSCILSAFKP